jgi:hypothetical protein
MQTLTAKNLGFIAKLNKVERIPVNDQKFKNLISDKDGNCFYSINEINELLKAWIEGWDSANNEYKKYSRKSKN